MLRVRGCARAATRLFGLLCARQVLDEFRPGGTEVGLGGHPGKQRDEPAVNRGERLRSGEAAGWLDAPGRLVVGAKGKYPHCPVYLLHAGADALMAPDTIPRVRTTADLAGLAATDLVLVEGYSEPVMASLAERLLPPAPRPTPAAPGPRARC